MQIEVFGIQPKETFVRFGVKFYMDLDEEIEIRGCRYFKATEKKPEWVSGPGIPMGGGKFFTVSVWSKAVQAKVIAAFKEALKEVPVEDTVNS